MVHLTLENDPEVQIATLPSGLDRWFATYQLDELLLIRQ